MTGQSEQEVTFEIKDSGRDSLVWPTKSQSMERSSNSRSPAFHVSEGSLKRRRDCSVQAGNEDESTKVSRHHSDKVRHEIQRHGIEFYVFGHFNVPDR